MPDPLSFPTSTARFGLPLLFAGQVQKEFFVNEAHVLCDRLLHPVAEAIRADPPSSATEGQAWIVLDTPGGAWAGHAGELAIRTGNDWEFLSPFDGLRVFDRSTSQFVVYSGGWHRPESPPLPSGGAVTDTEARSAIEMLVAALREARILPES